MKRCYLQKKKLRDYSGFSKGLSVYYIVFMNNMKNFLASIFKWLVAWKCAVLLAFCEDIVCKVKKIKLKFPLIYNFHDLHDIAFIKIVFTEVIFA